MIGQTQSHNPFSKVSNILANSMMESDPGFLAAVEEAKAGFEEGGVPIGACLVSKDGTILGRGHNMRVQKGSATLHVGLPIGTQAKMPSEPTLLRQRFPL